VVLPPPPPVVLPLGLPPPPLGVPVVDPVVDGGVTEPVVDPELRDGRGWCFRAGSAATALTGGTAGRARLTSNVTTPLSDGFEDRVARAIAKVAANVAISTTATSTGNPFVVNSDTGTASRIPA
jgi:hypothetical protein